MLNLQAVPAIVARILTDAPHLTEPRSLQTRNAYQARIVATICEAHRIASSTGRTEVALAVADAYRTHVPHS